MACGRLEARRWRWRGGLGRGAGTVEFTQCGLISRAAPAPAETVPICQRASVCICGCEPGARRQALGSIEGTRVQTILDRYVWMPLETQAPLWPGAMVSGPRPQTTTQRDRLSSTVVDTLRVRTQTVQREAGWGSQPPSAAGSRPHWVARRVEGCKTDFTLMEKILL